MGLCRVFLPLNTASKIAGKIVNWKQVPLFQSSHNEMVNSKTKQQCHFSDDSCGSPDLSRPTSSNPLLGNQRSSCRSRENQVQSICVYIHTHTPSHLYLVMPLIHIKLDLSVSSVLQCLTREPETTLGFCVEFTVSTYHPGIVFQSGVIQNHYDSFPLFLVPLACTPCRTGGYTKGCNSH